MDLVTEILSTLLAGLSGILMTIAFAAASRYRDARLASVGVALALFLVIGVLSLLHQLSPLYGGPYAVAPVPLALSVAAAALLYVALIRRPPTPTPAKHG